MKRLATARQPVPTIDPLLSIDDLVGLLRVGRRTFERLVSRGEFPKPDVRIGRRALWRSDSYRTWVGAQAAGVN